MPDLHKAASTKAESVIRPKQLVRDRTRGMHGQSENVSVEEKPNTILVKQVIPLLF